MKNPHPYKLTRLPAIVDAANALAQQAVLAQAALDFARVEPNGDVYVPEGGEIHLASFTNYSPNSPVWLSEVTPQKSERPSP